MNLNATIKLSIIKSASELILSHVTLFIIQPVYKRFGSVWEIDLVGGDYWAPNNQSDINLMPRKTETKNWFQ